jgi:hypothetical protein
MPWVILLGAINGALYSLLLLPDSEDEEEDAEE